MTDKKRFAVALVAVSITTSGCATSGLASLPLPKPGLSQGSAYTITAVFENALNLPAFAKVRLAGADVGEMETLEAKDYTAVATLRIRDGVELPQGTTVELRSATPLGDVFIALKPPANSSGAPLLKNGDTIGIENTMQAATVENLLTGAAVLVNGGAVQNLTDLINGAGKAAGRVGAKSSASAFRSLRLWILTRIPSRCAFMPGRKGVTPTPMAIPRKRRKRIRRVFMGETRS